MVVTAAGVSVDQVFTGDFSRNECFRTAGIPSDNKISTRLVVQFLRSKHCNENTGVKPSFVSSRRILRRVIGDKAKRLCVVSELRSRTQVSVPHRVSAESRRRKHISTSHDQPRQSLF